MLWSASVSINPWVLLYAKQDFCKGINGKRLWIRIVLEGDDSLEGICRRLGDPEEDPRTKYFLDYWKRQGFDMKIRQCGVRPDTKP